MVLRTAPYFRLAALISSFMIVIKTASLFKVSYFIGSYAAFFSASSMIQPLLGLWGGLLGTTLFVSANLLLRYSLAGISFRLLAYHIPGFFAAAYWARDCWFIRVLVPALCIALFIAHPVGFYAAPYAFYWLIPIALYFSNKKSIFYTSLGSTFTAHAVGSVIWLYATPMTSWVWLGLIPLVALERLVFALGMTGVYYATTMASKKIKQFIQSLVPALN